MQAGAAIAIAFGQESENSVITILTYFFAGLLLYPVYLVCWKNRFWFAFFLTWGLLIATQILASYGDTGGSSDTTEVGLTLFSGWLIALPYCLVLKLISFIFRRFYRGNSTRSSPNHQRQQAEQGGDGDAEEAV